MMDQKKKKDSVHISFRAPEEHRDFLDNLADEWDKPHNDIDNRSDVIRVLHKSFIGLLNGRLIALLDPDKIRENTDGFGKMVADYLESDSDVPEDILDLRLRDIVREPDIMAGAAEVELEEM